MAQDPTNTSTYRRNITERLLVLEGDTRVIKSDLLSVRETLEHLATEISRWQQQHGRINWGMVLTGFGVLVASAGVGFTVLAASLSVFWFLINSQVANIVNPIRADVALLTSQQKVTGDIVNSTIVPTMREVVSQNARSIQDREDLNKSVERIRDTVGRQDGAIVSNTEKLREVETQFKASDQNRNIQFSDQQRINSMMWNALSGIKAPMPQYPSAPFYQPQISKEGNGNNH